MQLWQQCANKHEGGEGVERLLYTHVLHASDADDMQHLPAWCLAALQMQFVARAL